MEAWLTALLSLVTKITNSHSHSNFSCTVWSVCPSCSSSNLSILTPNTKAKPSTENNYFLRKVKVRSHWEEKKTRKVGDFYLRDQMRSQMRTGISSIPMMSETTKITNLGSSSYTKWLKPLNLCLDVFLILHLISGYGLFLSPTLNLLKSFLKKLLALPLKPTLSLW